MKKLAILSISIIIFISSFKIITTANIDNVSPIKIGVLSFDESNYFQDLIKKDFLRINEENNREADLIFYNAEDNQELQNKQLDESINMKVDLIVLSIVDSDAYKPVIEKAKQSGIPIIFLNREPRDFNILKDYSKALFIGSETCQSGTIQGGMIVNELKNEQIKDRNKNNILDYVLLQGNPNNITTHIRSNCVIEELRRNGIIPKEIASEYCNWKKECAQEKIRELFKVYENDIDVIIDNNDEMAIGAVLALQEMGYNLGDPEKYIAVVGIDGIEEAIELIEKGEMTGTVIQDHEAMSYAVYRTGMNMIKGINPIDGTDYRYYTNQAIMIPYNGYIARKLIR